MLELEQAREKILSTIIPLSSETIPLRQAMGRYAAQAVASPLDLPPFDNSAMDGYAVRSEDIRSASPDSPVALQVIGKIPAGEEFPGTVASGAGVRIFTGSPLPPGADAVVMQEDSRPDPADPNRVLITDAAKPWENIRFRGEDLQTGFAVLQDGEKVSLGRLSLLGAVGVSEVLVRRRPLVGLLATGSELLEAGQPLSAGKIYESNRVGLAALAEKAGAVSRIYPLVQDDLETTKIAMEKALDECDVVVTSGGVSVGEFDFVKAAFEKAGGELAFWKVAIRPGKPFVFGQLRGKYLFGVPGNPVSALVTFFLLVQPALLRLQGASSCNLLAHRTTLEEPLQNPGDRRHFIRVKVNSNGNAIPTGIQASHILSSLAMADGLVDVPPKTTLPAGAIVSVLRWD